MPWKKVLYLDQGVPDNYVDPSFLTELKKNLFVRKYDLSSIIIEAGTIHQHLSCILIFIVLYCFMSLEWIAPLPLLLATLLLSGVLWLLTSCEANGTSQSVSGGRGRAMSVLLVFQTVTLSLTPVLKSLTETISTDTIYAMTVGLLLLNWALHDYTIQEPSQTANDALSVNAGLFAAICLASRLPSLWHTYATINLAVVTFFLCPPFLAYLRRVQFPQSQILLTTMLTVMTSVGLLLLAPLFAVLYVAVSVLVNLLLPCLFSRMQDWKNNIHGPWDEATIAKE